MIQVKRRDWQAIHQRIAEAYVAYFRDHQQQPTYEQLSVGVGVNRRTVARHMKDISYVDLFSDQRAAFAPLVSNVMIAIYNSAIKGSAKSQKLFLQIVLEWVEPKEFDTLEDSNRSLTGEELADIERGIDLLHQACETD